MRIKSFIASTVQEALENVKREMGEASIILETRNIEEGDIKSKAGQTLVEIIAAENVFGNGKNRDKSGNNDKNRDNGRSKEHDKDSSHRESGDDMQNTDQSKINNAGRDVKSGDNGNRDTKSPDSFLPALSSSRPEKAVTADDQVSKVLLADFFRPEDLIEMADPSPLILLNDVAGHVSEPGDGSINEDSESQAVRDNYWPEESKELYDKLCAQQVEREHAQTLINEVLQRLDNNDYGNMDVQRQVISQSIMNNIKAPDSNSNHYAECKTRVFIGATGTGKTTTICKLASETRKYSDNGILLISIRGNSAGKLNKIAGVIGATVMTVTTHQELGGIINEFGGNSHIFIDTPGINHLDNNTIVSLKRYLDEASKPEIHLVVSATTRYIDVINIVKKITVCPVHKLLFTKADETNIYGTLLSVAMETRIPLSFITDGQEIPEDIRPVTPEMVAEMIMRLC